MGVAISIRNLNEWTFKALKLNFQAFEQSSQKSIVSANSSRSWIALEGLEILQQWTNEAVFESASTQNDY